MKYLLNLLYLLALIIGCPWVLWRICVQKKNRRGWTQKLLGLVPKTDRNATTVWIHAVSVGEVNLLGTFIASLEATHPGIEICVSTTTETGFDLANKKFPDKQVFFCPADFSWSVQTAVKRIRPDLLILTELELWPNLISIVKQHSVPIALINGRISENSYRGYRRFGFLTRPMFTAIDAAAVQTDPYAARLIELGTAKEKITVTGNIKFDDNHDVDRSQTASLLKRVGIAVDDFVFVAGSTQEDEDLLAIAAYRQLKIESPNLKLVLVPRHPDRAARITKFLSEANLPYVQRSNLPADAAVVNDAVVIIDVIGELKQWWSRADVAFVGGSIGGKRGGQNMIEPAALAVPTCFGPSTANFKDVVELLLAEDAAKVVHDLNELKDFITFVMAQQAAAVQMGSRAQELVAAQQGASQRTIDCLTSFIPQTLPVADKRVA